MRFIRLSNLRFLSLRFQLLIIAVLAILPILGLILYTNVEQRQIAMGDAETNAGRLIMIASSHLGQNIEGAHQLLLSLAELSEVQQQNKATCSAFFAKLLQQYPSYLNLVAATPSGQIFCSAVPSDAAVSIADRSYFQQVLSTRQFVVGNYQIGRVTHKPSIVFALPVFDSSHRIQAVVIAVLNLSSLSQPSMANQVPQGGTLLVLDRNGTIINRYPDPNQWIGKSFQQAPLTKSILSGQPTHMIDLTGLDGVNRLYLFAPVEGTNNGMFVSIGIPQATAFAQADQTLTRNLIGLGLVTLATMVAIWFLGDKLILLPLSAILKATRRLADGDLSTRTKAAFGASELNQLAHSVDTMAESLEKSTSQLRHAEANYRTLVEHIPAITYRSSLDEIGSTLYVSPQIEPILGYKPEDWVSNSAFWVEHLHPDDLDRVLEEWERFTAEKKSWHSEYRMVGRNGKIIWFRDEASVVKEEGGEKTVLQGVMFDITEREQMQESIRQERDLMRAVMRTNPAGIVVLDRAGRITFANARAEALLGKPAENLLQRSYADPTWNIASFDGNPLKEAELPFSLAVERGRPVYDMSFAIQVGEHERKLLSANSAPLRDAMGEITGVVTTLEDITDRKQRERELEALVSVASALRGAVTRAEMLPVVLEQVLELLGVEGVLLAQADPATGEIVFEHAVGAWMAAAGQRMPPGTGISARVLETGEPYWNNQTLDDPSLIRSYFLGELRAAACVPLVTHRQSIGIIWVGKASDISENDVRLLTAIADIAGNALHRAALFEQTQLRLQRLMGLHSIDMSITGSLDIRVTMNLLLDQATSQLHVSAADIMMMHPDTQILEFVAGRGFAAPDQKTRLKLGDNYAGRVALDRQTLQVPDLQRASDSIAAALEAKGEHFGAYFAAPLIAKGQVRGVLEVFNRTPFYPDPEWLDFLETLATQAAIAIDNAELFEKLQYTNDELVRAYDATIEGWSHALELRDHETQGHSERVVEMSMRLARRLEIPDPQLGHFRRGVLLHDIGKMAIPDHILLKHGPLTPEEWEVMRQHPVYAYELLSPIPYLRSALEVPYAHHERWDGSGYPRGLKGEQIPLEARIFAVVDVWDALNSDRPYRKAWPDHKIRAYIEANKGIEFDPEVVAAFIDLKFGGGNRGGGRWNGGSGRSSNRYRSIVA
ncbi:MAG: GAF domain-containing protein [Chloroflexi bacterium]|nr:GAF domain-containing protein [Chloroflexota bacterium]